MAWPTKLIGPVLNRVRFFFAFNKQQINQIASSKRVVALDPNLISKTDMSTYGKSKYWSRVAKAVRSGFDICDFAIVDILNDITLYLNPRQTPSATELTGSGLNLQTCYASLVTGNAKEFKEFSDNIITEANFSKKPFC